MSIDPVTTDANTGSSFNRYNYAANNPYRYVDPDGRAIETVWDAGNVAMGAVSLAKNIAIGNYVGAVVDVVGIGLDAAATATPFVPGGAATIIKAARGVGDALPANALVVRGGTNKAEQFANASGVKHHADGTVSGVSVNSAPGKSVLELSQTIPNGKVGVTTVGDIRAAGGDVRRDPTRNNPDHCELCGLTPAQSEKLFNPIIPNPAK